MSNPHDHRLLTLTFNGHRLRSNGYSLEGCRSMVSKAKGNPLVSAVTIFDPDGIVVAHFIRADPGAPLVEVV